jgi:hypothetical protein
MYYLFPHEESLIRPKVIALLKYLSWIFPISISSCVIAHYRWEYNACSQ